MVVNIGRFSGLLLLFYAMILIPTSDGAISAPTVVNNEKTVDGPLRISSYMAPLAGDPTLKQLGSGLFERDMVELLASVLNFTFSPHKPPDVVSIGVRDANGSWNGCMGELVRREIDLCVTISQTWPEPDKFEVADFPVPIMFDNIGLIMPAPTERSKAYILVQVFSLEAWVCLLVSAVLMTTILWLSYFPNPELRELQMPFSRWVLYVIASLSMGERGYVMYHRGGDKSFSLVYRQNAFFWCLPAMVLLNGYKAVFFSLLSIPQYDYLISGINELPQRENEINLHVLRGTAIDNFFSTQTGPLKWVTDDLKKHPERKLNQNELDRVFDIVKDNNVFSCPVIGICLPLLEIDRKIHNPPLLYRSRQKFYPRGRTMVVQKGSPLRSMLDKQILLMQQHGLVDYISRRHLPVEPLTKKKEELKVLSLTDLIGTFILYGICFGLSLTTFVIEHIYYRVQSGPWSRVIKKAA